ncbi:MAG: CopD family protein [Bacteroidia bacterium]|jgi:uncharacterized membrane protein
MTAPAALLTLHLLAAAFWVGGMATMLFAVRPAVIATLQAPPQRLALLAAVLQRFFAGVTVAVVLLLASGVGLVLLGGGFAVQPARVHLMLLLGLVMMALFGHIRVVLFPRLRGPAAAVAMNGIRRWVSVNLVLGLAVFVVALSGR